MKYIDENIEKMKEDLKKLVSYNTVYSDDEKPFGHNNRLALDEAIKMMNEAGLKTNNLDYYCGYGDVGGGTKIIGIVCHLDVVPSGDGWDSDPFKMIEKDGYLYGRGVSDDKGAFIASLYAIKYLIDTKYQFNKKVRLILGCNEETGSKCMEHYVKTLGHVNLGFTPDGDFPGIFAEKGMISGLLHGKSKIMYIEGGVASNVVCKRVNALLNVDDFDLDSFKYYLDNHQIKYDINLKGKLCDINVYGKAAHASVPDLGINAINYLMEALFNSGIDDELVNVFHQYLSITNHGELLGFLDLKDEYTDTSINAGLAYFEDDEIKITLDMRYPVKAKGEDCLKLLNKMNDGHIKLDTKGYVKPLFFDLNNPMIKALKKAYEDVTGDKETKMEAIGGGTYAKSMNNIIAFGCEFINEDNHIHDANERLSIESFKKQVEIYINAIINLDKEC